jgi:hypothetical protein
MSFAWVDVDVDVVVWVQGVFLGGPASACHAQTLLRSCTDPGEVLLFNVVVLCDGVTPYCGRGVRCQLCFDIFLLKGCSNYVTFR